MDLNDAAVFVKVVQTGSFSAAARLLGAPTSTVSNRVGRLEQHLGVTLLQRTTRRLHLTEAGARYYQHAAEGLAHLQQAEAALGEAAAEPGGLLRVTAPADLGDRIFAEILGQMRSRYPKVRVELLLMSRQADLVAEGIDVAIRAGRLADSSLITKPVGIACWAPFASPQYLARAPALETPQDLARHCCLQFTRLGATHWTLSEIGGGGTVQVALSGQILVNDIGVIAGMALAGEGVALLPVYLYREACAKGELVRLLPAWQAEADPIQLLYPRQAFLAPKLRTFVELAAQVLRHWLD